MYGEMATDMRASGVHAFETATALTSFLTEINTSANTNMAIQMGSASINGKMEIHMQENSLMV
jgi:hypothetical protein